MCLSQSVKVDASGSQKKEALLDNSSSALPIWKFGPEGWRWATGSKGIQLVGAASTLMYVLILFCSFALFSAPPDTKMPSPVWNFKPNDAGMHYLPILHLNLQNCPGGAGVDPRPQQECPAAKCDWAKARANCNCTLNGKENDWCKPDFVEKKFPKRGGTAGVGVVVLVVAAIGIALSVLQLTGKRPVMPPKDAVLDEATYAALPRSKRVVYWLKPVIDRVAIAAVMFIVIMIAIGMSGAGSESTAELDFTKAHKGCFTNEFTEQDWMGASCPIQKFTDFADAIAEWEEYLKGGDTAGKDAMAVAAVFWLIAVALLVVLHVKFQRCGALVPGGCPAAAVEEGGAPSSDDIPTAVPYKAAE